MLQQIYKQEPRLWGGSADVASTTKAYVIGPTPDSNGKNRVEGKLHFCDGSDDALRVGRDIAFGVREHAMAAICNGLALHGFMPYCSTFLAFSDYLKPALRLTALMNLPVHYIFTHDGFGNPPDGPTHQATEHIAALRLVPNLTVYRPCDDVETASVYRMVYENATPAATILSRGGGKVNVVKDESRMHATERGGYILSRGKSAQATVISTGADIELVLQAQEILDAQGIGINVVSMPSVELFERQDEAYRTSVLGNLPIVAVEMGSGVAWHKYADRIISFDTFGHSGAESELRTEFGFTPEHVSETVRELL